MEKHAHDRAGDGSVIQPLIFAGIPPVDLVANDNIIKSLKKSPHDKDDRHADDRKRDTACDHIVCDQDMKRMIPVELARKNNIADRREKARDRPEDRFEAVFSRQSEPHEGFLPQNADDRNAQSGDSKLDGRSQQQSWDNGNAVVRNKILDLISQRGIQKEHAEGNQGDDPKIDIQSFLFC